MFCHAYEQVFAFSSIGRIVLLAFAVLLLWALFAGESGAGVGRAELPREAG